MPSCKVKGCTEPHSHHYCKTCGDSNSNHWSDKCKKPVRRGCKVPGCLEIHERHYCKECNDSDSNHRSTDCQKIKRNPPSPPIKKNWMQQKWQQVTNKGGCKVEECDEKHDRHYCKECGDHDADHRSSDCQANKRAGATRAFTKQKSINGGCKVQGCEEQHDWHYCKECGDPDSDHRSSDCQGNTSRRAGATRGFTKQKSINDGCKVEGCEEQHDRHYCKECGDRDADHRSSECQANEAASTRLPPKMPSCGVEGCSLGHYCHTCDFCGDENSDHFEKQCPHALLIDVYCGEAKGAHCKASGCKKWHSKHLCDKCKDPDSDHLVTDCPQSIFHLPPMESEQEVSTFQHKEESNLQSEAAISPDTHALQSKAAISSDNHALQSKTAISADNHALQSKAAISSDKHTQRCSNHHVSDSKQEVSTFQHKKESNLQSEAAISSDNHALQRKASISSDNYALQSKAAISSDNHALQSKAAISSDKHTQQCSNHHVSDSKQDDNTVKRKVVEWENRQRNGKCEEADATHHFSRGRNLKQVAGGLQDHATNFCEMCHDKDEDHLSAKWPWLNRGSSSLHCKVLRCAAMHDRHYCDICKDEDSDHYTKDCPHKYGNSSGAPLAFSKPGAMTPQLQGLACAPRQDRNTCEKRGDQNSFPFRR